ncbi:MAG: GatB/YqeY domain-containing protein [Rhodospirillaceae bacterium]
MLRERFNEALKDAMRAGDKPVVSTIRMILAAVKDRDIAARPSGNTGGIDDGQIVTVLHAMIKQRRESIEMYRQGGRQELVDKEAAEITAIESFMPKQMSEDETKAAVEAVVKDVGAASIKDMGKVMVELRLRHAGMMDFAKAGPLVKQALSQ